MIKKIKVSDLGYNGFYTRTLPLSNRFSSVQSANMFTAGGISASQISVPLNATTDIVFSSTDSNTAAWTAGTVYFADGTKSDEIASGNTGNISAQTYIYYDRDVPLILSTTTDHSRAVGNNKILVAIVEEGESGKDCKITPTIAAGLNVSGITADQIAANTITATEISGNQLDVVAANTGTLNVDEYITLGSDSNVKIDGANKRILISDGIDDRILIGYQSGGF